MTKDHRNKSYITQGEKPDRSNKPSKSYAFIFSDNLIDWGVSKARESREKSINDRKIGKQKSKGRAANL